MKDTETIKIQKQVEMAAEFLKYSIEKQTDKDYVKQAYQQAVFAASSILRRDYEIEAEVVTDEQKIIYAMKKLESASLLLDYKRGKDDDDYREVESVIRSAITKLRK